MFDRIRYLPARPENADLAAAIGEAHAAEWRSLNRERDPDIYCEGLLQLGRRLEAEDRLDAAGRVYAAVAADASSPEVRGRAQSSLDAMAGVGSAAERSEFLLRRLSREAMEPTGLVGLTAASAVFRMARVAALSRLIAAPSANLLTRGFGAQAAAGLLGFGAEALAFPAATRGAALALGRELDWSAGRLGQEMLSSFLVLGPMKAMGWAAGIASRRLGGRIAAPLFQQTGLLAGIAAGHRLESAAGLRPTRDGATSWIDSLALLIQFNVAGRLAQGVMGSGFRAWETGLEIQARFLAPPARGGRGLVTAVPAGPAVEWAGAFSAPSREVGPPRLFMTGSSDGNGYYHKNALAHATELRESISQPDAWRGRAEGVKNYLLLMEKMPKGEVAVLEELLHGVIMLGEWTGQGDSFLQAVAYRHYDFAWHLLADRFGATLPEDARFYDRLEGALSRHEQLLKEESKGPFLRALLRASPSAAHSAARARYSLRGEHFTMAIFSLLQTTSERTEGTRNPAFRPEMLVSLLGVMEHAPSGDPRTIHENAFILGILRDWIQNEEGVGRELALRYLPRFWQCLARKAVPHADVEHSQRDLVDEVAFLQQLASPRETRLPFILAALRSYPYYAVTVMGLMPSHPMHTFMMVRALMSVAKTWRRPWMLKHLDPEIRAESGSSYLNLMSLLHEAAARVEKFRGQFPVDFHAELFTETLAGTEAFLDRLNGSGDINLVRSIQDFSALVDLLPAGDAALEVLNDAPRAMTRVFLHPDPKVREAAENALISLLNKLPGKNDSGN